jgi:3',5'-cyclic AMP phosphodiesterase CpdA
MSNSDFTIVHLSDFHIQSTDAVPLVGLDTFSRAKAAIQAVKLLHVTPNLIIITGDLTHEGDDNAYGRFLDVVNEFNDFGCPLLLTLGNHDNRSAFYRVFKDRINMENEQSFHYCVDVGDLRIFALDTLIPGAIDGQLDAHQLKWLEQELASSTDYHKLIIMHHPPILSPVPGMHLLKEPERLERIVREYEVLGILCGHVHFSNTSIFGGAVCSSAPSVAFGIDPSTHNGLRYIDQTGFNLISVQMSKKMLVTPISITFERPRQLHYIHP